ncbi:hypothetical protein B0H14DRAFT_2622351 [Mycena olivaceomarginata]|nr:hypothetical protein B0H14DRAFT_2622351 [Mycena olivaceomarginata]
MWLRATESPWLRATESTGYALVEILVSEIFPRSHLRRQPQTQRRDYPYLIQAEVLFALLCNNLELSMLPSPQSSSMAPHSLHKPLSPALSSGPDSVDVQMHSNLEEANKSSLLVGTADVSVAVQPVPLMHSIIEETDPLLVETADISVDVLTDTRAVEAADETTAHIRAAWKLTEETNKLLHGTAGTTRNFKVKRRRPLTPSYNYYFSYN